MKVGDVVEGKYELVRLIGQGGMGVVFEARHLVLGRRLALKCIAPGLANVGEPLERFLREARAAATIASRHVAEVHDAGVTDGGIAFMAMELLEGEDLRAVLARQGRLAPFEAVRIVAEACEGVAAAHRRGVVHRDLKPDNLFLARDEEGRTTVKVVDFGIAKLRDDVGGPKLTATGATFGTPFYMAPEQARGARFADHLSDVYSMGVILYELLAGSPPFAGASFGDVLVKILTETPASLRDIRPELRPELEAVVRRAMAPEAADRYQSMEELAEALAPFAAGFASGREPAPTVPGPPPGGSTEATAGTPPPSLLDSGTPSTPSGAPPARRTSALVVAAVVVGVMLLLGIVGAGLLAAHAFRGRASGGAGSPLGPPSLAPFAGRWALSGELVENGCGAAVGLAARSLVVDPASGTAFADVVNRTYVARPTANGFEASSEVPVGLEILGCPGTPLRESFRLDRTGPGRLDGELTASWVTLPLCITSCTARWRLHATR